MSEQRAPVLDLEEAFERRTHSRRVVLEAVVAWPRHFSAEELCRALPQVGRATVYRTLASLQRVGVLCRVMVAEGGARYQMGATSHHHHLVCVDCGSVRNIDGCGVDDLVRSVEGRFGYAPIGHRLEMYGRCVECQVASQ